MRPGQSLSKLTSRLLNELENQFAENRPDLVLAHGDTTTCFATAISSFYHQIPFFHVEAGLRSNRLNSPFPEEFNRQMITPIAHHHFTPTEVERANLIRDGVAANTITVSGSTVHEAVEHIRTRSQLNFSEKLPLQSEAQPVVTVTLHRREGANGLQHMLNGLKATAQSRPNTIFVCPVHPNPIVQSAFHECLNGIENVVLTDPLEYPQFVSLLLRSQLVITDSGGVQEEAAFLGKPVLLAREETERRDGLLSGLVKLVGLDPQIMQDAIISALDTQPREQIRLSEPTLKATPASEIITEEVRKAVG